MLHLRDLTDYACSPQMSLREVMARIGNPALKFAFQIVVGEVGQLLGTITDGDIRRAILRGRTLEEPASAIMQARPKAGRVGSDEANLELLRAMTSRTAFLPLLDERDAVAEVIVLANREAPRFPALIMAGGFGRRLGEYTRNVPKPLLPVGQKPILEHILTRLENEDVGEIYVAVHHLADQIEAFLAQRNNRNPVKILREQAPLGTAGAIGLLGGKATEPILVLNGDIVTSLDLAAFFEFHTRHGYDATIAVAQHRVNIPYGVVRHGAEGQFLGIEEKPTLTNYVAAGIYLLSPEYRALTPAGCSLDMPELLRRGTEIGLTAGLFPIHEYWTDVGRPEDLEEARYRHTAEPK